MIRTEKDLEIVIKENIALYTSRYIFKSIENSNSTGMPDIYYCIQGEDKEIIKGWLELKLGTITEKGMIVTQSKVRPSQISWQSKCDFVGENSKLVVGLERNKEIFLYFICSYPAVKLLSSNTLSVKNMHKIPGFFSIELLKPHSLINALKKIR